jgi:hypothetical protein
MDFYQCKPRCGKAWDLESSLTTHQNTCKIFAEDEEAQRVDLRVRLQQSHQAKRAKLMEKRKGKGKMIYQTNEMEVEVSQAPGVLSCKWGSNVDFVSHDFKTPLSPSELLRQETTHAITLKLTDGDNSSKSHMEKYTTERQVDLDDVRDSNFVRSFPQTYMTRV